MVIETYRFDIFCCTLLVALVANAGVGDTTVIDAIGSGPDSPEAVLLLHQARPWTADSKGLLQQKLDFYQTVIRSGTLVKQRPDLNGKTFRVVVIYADAPTDDAVQLLSERKSSMLAQGIVLRWGFQKQIPELLAR